MKFVPRQFTCTLMALVAWLAIDQRSPAATRESAFPAVVQADNQFAADLYGQLSREQPGKNLFFSPTSISIALAMTAAGAREQTETEMAQVLHLTGILPQAHAEYHKLLQRWNADGKDRGYQLRVANRLWGQKGFPFLAGYLALTRHEYGAELGVVDFAGHTEAARQEINAWVEKQTSEKIKDLIPRRVLDPMTALVLTNAIYFKGDWANPFKKEQTRDQDFAVSATQKVKVPMMQQMQTCLYGEDASLQALELPYKGDELSMLVLLPKTPDGLADVEKSLSAEEVARLRPKLRAREVHVYLPKFKLEASYSLKKALQALGMKLAFSSDMADFSGMDGRKDLFISAVLHKAFVDVNEAGTEAAAATAVVMSRNGSPTPVFRADHPFMFMICDKRDGSILFLGRMTNPKQSAE